MKCRTLTGFVLLGLGIGFGIGFEKVRSSFAMSGDSSLVGSTLSALYQAAEAYRDDTGQYPDSIDLMEVTSSSPEFSLDLLGQVHYFKTNTGFVAFIGIPRVGFVESQRTIQFETTTFAEQSPADQPHSQSSRGG